MNKGGEAARVAAERWLVVAEEYYERVFLPHEITKAARDLEEAKALKAELERITVATQDRYRALEQFGLADHSAAALVRYGEAVYLFADKMARMPVPVVIVDLERRRQRP